jgi:hypothetical protein
MDKLYFQEYRLEVIEECLYALKKIEDELDDYDDKTKRVKASFTNKGS